MVSRTIKPIITDEDFSYAKSIIANERIVALSFFRFKTTNFVSLIIATNTIIFLDSPKLLAESLNTIQHIIKPETQIVVYDDIIPSIPNLLRLEPLIKLVDTSWQLEDAVLHLCHYRIEDILIAGCPIEMINSVRRSHACYDLTRKIQRTLTLTSDCEILTPPNTPPLPTISDLTIRKTSTLPIPSITPNTIVAQPTTNQEDPRIQAAMKWLETFPNCHSIDAATNALLNSYSAWAGTTHRPEVRKLALEVATKFMQKNENNTKPKYNISDDIINRAISLLRSTHPPDVERRRDKLVNQLTNSLGILPVQNDSKRQYLEYLIDVLIQKGILKRVNETQLAITSYKIKNRTQE